MNIVEPRVGLSSCTCPYCNTLAELKWDYMDIHDNGGKKVFSNSLVGGYIQRIGIATCNCCGNFQLWLGDMILIPDSIPLPLPIEDMPEDVKEIYNEARGVYSKSSKAAAALLRLALQKLCVYLGEPGININIDIKSLVAKGLDTRIQKSLDILRITGNNAVHPGEMNLDEDNSIVVKLFDLMNYIVTKMITEPQEIDSFFENMPESTKEGIEKRDKI